MGHSQDGRHFCLLNKRHFLSRVYYMSTMAAFLQYYCAWALASVDQRILKPKPHSTVWSLCKIVQWMSRTFWHVSSLKCCVNIIYIVLLLLLLWSSPPWSATFLNKTQKRKKTKKRKRPPLTTLTSFYKDKGTFYRTGQRAPSNSRVNRLYIKSRLFMMTLLC